MKKIIALSLLTGMIICLSACGSQTAPASSGSKASSSAASGSSSAPKSSAADSSSAAPKSSAAESSSAAPKSQAAPASSAAPKSQAAVNSSAAPGSSAVNAPAYTDEELCKLAADHYQSENGQKPPITEVDHKDGNLITIHLYEDAEDHTATWDWYEVDITTGKATNLMGESFELF